MPSQIHSQNGREATANNMSSISLGGVPADSPIRKTLSYEDKLAGSGESSDEEGLPPLETTLESFNGPSGAREAMMVRRGTKCGHKHADGVYAGRVCGRQARVEGGPEPDGVTRCVACSVQAAAIEIGRKYDNKLEALKKQDHMEDVLNHISHGHSR